MLSLVFLGCNGSLQTEKSGNTSLIISSQKTSILVDVSTNLHVAVNSDIDAVFLTHEHIDHIYALPSLIHQMWISGRKKALTIIASEEVLSLIDGMLKLHGLYSKKGIFEIILTLASSHTFEEMTIDTFKTDHTACSFGLEIRDDNRCIVYTGDTKPIKDIKQTWMNADLLLHEASGVSKEEEIINKKGHSSGLDAANLATKINAKHLILCHLPIKSEDVIKEAKNVFLNSDIPELLKPYHI